MIKKTLTAACILLGASSAWAGGSLDIGLANESIRVEHDATRVGTGAHVTAGVLYNELQGYAFSAGFNAVDATGANKQTVGGVGVKAFIYDAEDEDIAFSAAVGGFARYTPDYLNGLGLEAILYYSPDVISFNNTSSMYEFAVRLNYKVMPQARVFLGYQDVSATYEDGGKKAIDRGINIGFRMNY